MAGELIDFGTRIEKILDPAVLERITKKAGGAAKGAALGAAVKDFGADRRMTAGSRNGGRKLPALGAGWDEAGGTLIRLNFRPAGIWKLADSGRRGGKTIRPRRRLGGAGSGHAPALRTPSGWRARSTTGYWGGKGTFTAAVRDARVKVPKAAFKQFQSEVRRVVK